MNPEYKNEKKCFQTKKEFKVVVEEVAIYILTTNATESVIKKAIDLLIECNNKNIYKLTEILVVMGFDSEYRLSDEIDFIII